LKAYGPTTLPDISRWWAMRPVNARRLLTQLGDEVVPVEIDGTPHWALAGDLAAIEQSAPSKSVRLLPGFDQ
jgi:hypothetical protein